LASVLLLLVGVLQEISREVMRHDHVHVTMKKLSACTTVLIQQQIQFSLDVLVQVTAHSVSEQEMQL